MLHSRVRGDGERERVRIARRSQHEPGRSDDMTALDESPRIPNRIQLEILERRREAEAISLAVDRLGRRQRVMEASGTVHLKGQHEQPRSGGDLALDQCADRQMERRLHGQKSPLVT